MARRFQLEGMDEVLKMLRNVEKLPQKCVNKSARNGAKIPMNDAKNNAPYLTGELASSIGLKAERTSKQGKKVYQVIIKDNPLFIKIAPNGNRYYYPASMEYGFKLRNGGKVQGLHFMRKAMDNNNTQIERTMVNVLTDEIDKLG